MSFGQNINIPDANFKNYLVNNAAINTNGDSEIQVIEASAFTGTIDCPSQNISDLTGIEAFTALTELNCSFNNLTSLDVSNNTALTELLCEVNQITSLVVSNNTALEDFICGYNQLTSLDVSNNTALTELDCHFNQIASLNVSGASILFNLVCWGNQLTSLDVSNNTALNYLWCSENQLTSLDVSNNTALMMLHCWDNQLTSLDVSNNTALNNINAWKNDLTCLNVKNGANTNFLFFGASLNPNLTCVEVDDVNYSTTNWTSIDPQTSFSTDCNNACSNTSSISELNNTPKQLVKIVDVLGREKPFKPNTPLLYIYNDGTVERKMIIKE